MHAYVGTAGGDYKNGQYQTIGSGESQWDLLLSCSCMHCGLKEMQLIFRLRGVDDVGCETHVLVAICYFIKMWFCRSSQIESEGSNERYRQKER
jgi:hypothetical protein